MNLYPIMFRVIICAPSSKELLACDRSQIRLIFDLKTGNIMEIEKRTSVLDDSSLFQKLEQPLETLASRLREILEIQ